MTKDEFQKAVDDVIADCIRNDYSFGIYARKVTEAVWPVLEAAEKERESLRQGIAFRDDVVAALAVERDTLRARIEQMEQQEPDVWMQSTHLSSFKNRLCGSQSSYVHCSDHQLHPDFKPLYALPGAQNVPSVPKKIGRVESGFKGMFLREAQAYKRGWNECRGAMLAAAPEVTIHRAKGEEK